jgi:hypothetical protein
MITLEYDAVSGLVLPDGKISQYVSDYIEQNRNNDVSLVISQCHILNMFRLHVKNGNLNNKDIVVKFQDLILRVDCNGTLESWPVGMADYIDRLYTALAGWDV